MPYSFLRDLFELNMGEFSQRYGGPISGVQFADMKARCGNTPHSKLLALYTLNNTSSGTLSFASYIVTKVFVQVHGTASSLDVTLISDDPGTFEIALSTAPGWPTYLCLEGVEFNLTSLTVAPATGAPVAFIEVHGYRPPSTNP